MTRYIVSKYNPKDKCNNNFNPGLEWSSISDVGKTYSNRVLTISEYLKIENDYITTINCFIENLGIDQLKIINIEKYKLNRNQFSIYDDLLIILHSNIVKGQYLKRSEISTISRLALREDLWCILYNQNPRFILEFGYDFYVFIKTQKQMKGIINSIQETTSLYITT